MPAITDYPAFVIAILLFLAIPGPGNLAIISSTAQGRVRGGLASTFGIIAGDQILVWWAGAGVVGGIQQRAQAAWDAGCDVLLVCNQPEAVAEALGPEATLTGFYSYGEIARGVEGEPCCLHNQTMMVTVLQEIR